MSKRWRARRKKWREKLILKDGFSNMKEHWATRYRIIEFAEYQIQSLNKNRTAQTPNLTAFIPYETGG